MKYFIDTEFHEYKKKVLPWSKGIDTIELISIGIVAEDGREYYAISKEFDLKDAWNSYQEEVNVNYKPSFGGGQDGTYNSQFIRIYWLRENVLKLIWKELFLKDEPILFAAEEMFTYSSLKHLLKKYGKSKTQIAKDVKSFTLHKEVYFEKKTYPVDFIKDDSIGILFSNGMGRTLTKGTFKWKNPEFYGYYADYDWVVFCWLFGKMIDLPKGFPKYCRDLKQMLDEKGLDKEWKRNNCPDPEGEHNALVDAKWNLKLFNQMNAHENNDIN